MAPVINGARYWAITQEHINVLFSPCLSYPLRRRTKESMKANRKSSNKESNIPIFESPEVKHAPLGADEFGTPILPTLTRAVEPAPATEPDTVTVETTVPVIEKKAGKAKAAKPAPVAPVSKLRVTDDELQVLIKEQHAKH